MIGSLTIAGKSVAADDFDDHAWITSLGVKAPENVWLLPPDVADEVLKNQETEIVFTPPNGPPKTYKRVVVVGERPSGDPLMRAIVLSDVRWYWPRIRVSRRYNMTTHSAARRLLLPSEDAAAVPVELAPDVFYQVYAPYSLKGGGARGSRPWQPDEIVTDLLTYVSSRTSFAGGSSAFQVAATRLKTTFVPQNQDLDGLPADIAIATALGLLGGVEIRVEPDGSVTVLDSWLGAERTMLETRVKYSIDGSALWWVHMDHVAPITLNVSFKREVELRCDSWEQAPTTGTTSLEDLGTLPIMVNVIQVTDLELAGVPDLMNGGTYTAVAGMYVEVDALATAVAALGDYPDPPGPLTRAWAQDHWFGALMENTYVSGFLDGSGPSRLWAARIGAWRRDYRRTYQLNPTIAAQCIPGSITPLRVALIDPSTGTRAPAPAYFDFCRRPTVRGLKKDVNLGWNVSSIPPDVGQDPGNVKAYGDPAWPDELAPIDGLTVSPAVVSVWDSTVGILHLDLVRDAKDQSAELVPSLVSNLPVVDPSHVSISGATAIWEQAQLLETHRVVTILSAQPAGPNNEGSLHTYAIGWQEAVTRLGLAPSSAIVNPAGPPFDLHVGARLARATIAWDDDQREVLLSFFTDPNGEDEELAAEREDITPVNDDQLRDYAVSQAAVLMACMLDHYEGDAWVDFDPGLVPMGSVHTVEHRMTSEGVFLTRILAASIRPNVNPEFSMSQGTRAALFQSLGS